MGKWQMKILSACWPGLACCPRFLIEFIGVDGFWDPEVQRVKLEPTCITLGSSSKLHCPLAPGPQPKKVSLCCSNAYRASVLPVVDAYTC